jgi:peptidoglycan/LPS O-acetylase OafA/YrhL
MLGMYPAAGNAMLEKGLLEEDKFKPNTNTGILGRATTLLRPSLGWVGRQRSNSGKKLHRTAYLDGLRGFAALMVYCLHHQVWGHAGIQGEFILENAFGWENQYYFICLPGIRLFFSGGHFAVAIFFVISGYVLSAKPLALISAGETTQLADNLGSALFRRWLRLFIPVFATTFVWMSTWHIFGIYSSNPIAQKPEKNWKDEVWMWYCAVKNFSFVFQGEPWLPYNDHTWSIPMEFRGSIVVYTSLLAFARCSRNCRLWCEAGLILYFIYIVDGWFCGLFIMGMLLCDLDLLAQKNQLPGVISSLKPAKTYIFYTLFAISLYLGGIPSITNDLQHLRDSPGWYYLSFLKPQAFWDFRWFYRFWAATFLVASLPHIDWLRSIFETRICQYLGKVSFGFYLVHGPVLWSLGDRVYAMVGRVRDEHSTVCPEWINRFAFPSWGPFGLEMNYLLAHLILLPVTLWLAELVTVLFDETSVKIAQWAYKRTLEPVERFDSKSRSELWAKA